MDHRELTYEIIAACLEVANELGHGFLESVYERALLIVLADRGLAAESQVPLTVWFRGRSVGDFAADIVVDRKVIIELKAVKALGPEHQAQLIHYLNATGIDVGLLVNFGASSLDWKRCHRNRNKVAAEDQSSQRNR